MAAAALATPIFISDFPKLRLRNFRFSEIMDASGRLTREKRQPPRMQYFVVMIDYGRRGREAVVDPEITRREVISRIASGEYANISFIHEIADRAIEDVTEEILAEAALPEISASDADLQAGRFDHARDLRKHETA
jgi:hypothetical protein